MILTLFNICPTIKMVNYSKESWNKHDFKIKESAIRRCPMIYSEAPCVKIFQKVEPRVYRVQCGGKK